ncbi:hypothetical protein POPTR_015G123001v4 [Populus trichocarpa]|uniref:Uncharacterized protein n=1 Tax=Populus trichocarpa TaxID=3694 RepID=A0ACC0RWL4_POPTR|nr:hypothetical protein POPTR_015G123001v4 [Populus trichocarpa]
MGSVNSLNNFFCCCHFLLPLFSRIGFFIRAPITISWYVFSKQESRKDWLSILMIVTSARSSINIRHLEKATVSTGKEGLLSEGNAAYNWSRVLHDSQRHQFARVKFVVVA